MENNHDPSTGDQPISETKIDQWVSFNYVLAIIVATIL